MLLRTTWLEQTLVAVRLAEVGHCRDTVQCTAAVPNHQAQQTLLVPSTLHPLPLSQPPSAAAAVLVLHRDVCHPCPSVNVFCQQNTTGCS